MHRRLVEFAGKMDLDVDLDITRKKNLSIVFMG